MIKMQHLSCCFYLKWLRYFSCPAITRDLSCMHASVIYIVTVLHTLVLGLLARSQYPEGPATGQLSTGFFLVSLCLKANAEMVAMTPSRYCMLLM
jgi:hypothetical protein